MTEEIFYKKRNTGSTVAAIEQIIRALKSNEIIFIVCKNEKDTYIDKVKAEVNKAGIELQVERITKKSSGFEFLYDDFSGINGVFFDSMREEKFTGWKINAVNISTSE